MKPGDVVVGAFPGAQVTKNHPAVVLSTEAHHRHRPDVVVGLITTQALRHFRLFPVTLRQREVRLIERLSDSDWGAVRVCFETGFGGE